MRLPPPPNLIAPTPPPSDARPAAVASWRRRVWRIAERIAITGGVLFLVLAWTTRSSSPNVFVALRDSGAVRSVLTLIRSPNVTLRGERQDRVRILLLGIGGNGHEGPLLADTILLLEFQPSTRRVALVSIPRDLGIPTPNGGIEKANAINAFGEQGTPGRGSIATRDALARELGFDIPYHVRIDFAGFAGLIDELGGVEVDVERTLDDPEYPIAGKENAPWAERFEHLVIPAGRQRFDGALALKYVRSRHARGAEGSDFARGRRQQRILLALRDRVLTPTTLVNPRSLLALLDAYRAHVDTNLTPPELYRLASLGNSIADDAITHVVFSDAPGGELTSRIMNGAYVLVPRDGSFDRIRAKIADAFSASPLPATPSPTPAVLAIEVWNGTTVSGLAARTADLLAAEGLEVTAIRNAPVQSVTRSVIYYRPTVPADVVTRLQRALNADVSTAFPSILTTPIPDLLVIVGSSTSMGILGLESRG
ncbi:LCP family protein [Candidatus Uhrbacteria bacterium]|nr:LCP family protein [Candidatus Uhrbacteria bacterium]